MTDLEKPTLNKNEAILQDFVNYCRKHPDLRFWQALRDWSRADKILYQWHIGSWPVDTYFWENKHD